MSSQEPSQHDAGESLLAILDEVRSMIAGARAMPMSSSALVNRAEVLDLLESARSVVPESIDSADRIVADADAVLERARTRADQIVSDAESQAARLVSDESVVHEAERLAARIVAEAEDQAAKLAADANDYCDRQLAQFESELGSIGAQVRAGRHAIAARSGRPFPEDAEQGVHDEGAERREHASGASTR